MTLTLICRLIHRTVYSFDEATDRIRKEKGTSMRRCETGWRLVTTYTIGFATKVNEDAITDWIREMERGTRRADFEYELGV